MVVEINFKKGWAGRILSILLILALVLSVVYYVGFFSPNRENGNLVPNTHQDSLVYVLQQHPIEGLEKETYRTIWKLKGAQKTADRNSIIDWFQSRVDDANNEAWHAFLFLMKGYDKKQNSDLDSALIYQNKALELAKFLGDSSALLFAHFDLGTTYYKKGENTKASLHYESALELAENQGNDFFISKAANNLGDLYVENWTALSKDYYFKALAACDRMDSVFRRDEGVITYIHVLDVLISSAKDIQGAKEFYKKYKDLFPKDKDHRFAVQSLLTEVGLFQATGSWNEADSLLKQLSLLPLGLNEWLFHKRNAVQQQHEVGGNTAYLKSLLPALERDYPFSFLALNEEIMKNQTAGTPVVDYETLIRWHGKQKEESYGHAINMIYYRLLGNINMDRGAYQDACQNFKKELAFTKAFTDQTDSMKKLDFSARIEIATLSNEALNAEKRLLKITRQRQLFMFSGILVFLLAAFVIYNLWLKRKHHFTELLLHKNKMESQKKEMEFFVKEQRLSGRLIALSQIIVVKSEEIRKRLSKLSQDIRSPELEQIKKELDQIIHASDGSHPEMADAILEENYEMLERNFQIGDKLNLTEKRILMLSLENYRVKEIANVLGLSVQYIANSRSKIRKVLEIAENEEWNEVKNNVLGIKSS